MMSGKREPPSFLLECWHNVYADHYLQTLREKEAKRPITTLQSKQLKYRGYLILKLQRVSSRLALGSRILHAGVQILDVIMDVFDVDEERLMHVALICLLLATKFEIKGASVPRFSELCRVADIEYISESELWQLEWDILQHLKWDLCFPTVVTFVDFYFPFAITKEDYEEWLRIDSRNVIPHDKFKLLLRNKVKSFVHLTLSCMKFAPTSPSLVAAGCLQAARSVFGLNAWTNKLRRVTKYEHDVVLGISNLLCRLMATRNNNTPMKQKYSDTDSGYSSPESNSKRSMICCGTFAILSGFPSLGVGFCELGGFFYIGLALPNNPPSFASGLGTGNGGV